MENGKKTTKKTQTRSTREKSANEREGTIRRSIWLSTGTYDTILNLAAEKKTNSSIVIRQLINDALDVHFISGQEDTIRRYMREELETILDKQTDRFIKLILKSTKASAASLFALLALLKNDVSDDGMEKLFANALHSAAVYMKTKEKTDDEYCKEARELLKSDITKRMDT